MTSFLTLLLNSKPSSLVPQLQLFFSPLWNSAFIRPPAIFVFPTCKSDPATLLHRLHHSLTDGVQGPPRPDSPMDTPCPSGGTDSKSPAYPSTGTDCFLSPRSIPLNLDCFLSPRSIPLNLDLVLRGSVQFRLPLPGGAPAVCGCSSGRAPHPVSQTPWHAHPTLFTGAMAAASSTPGRRISMDIPHPSLFSSLKKRLTQRKHRRDEELRRTLWNKLPHLYWCKLNTAFSRTTRCSLLPCNRV